MRLPRQDPVRRLGGSSLQGEGDGAATDRGLWDLGLGLLGDDAGHGVFDEAVHDRAQNAGNGEGCGDLHSEITNLGHGSISSHSDLQCVSCF